MTPVSSSTFRAWGTYVFVATRRPSGLTLAGRLTAAILDDIDRTCSRFREDSDLARVNDHAGSWVEVDPLLVAAVEVACTAARHSGGLVNPLLGRHLVELGYDRDFGLLPPDTGPAAELEGPSPSPDAWRQVRLDPDGGIRIPSGSALDLGATAKAWAADVVAAALAREVAGSSLVSLGGDLAIAAPDGDPWPVGVSTHPGAEPDTVVGLDRGGLATSSTRVRRWRRSGVRRHHVLDPRTGLPAAETWATVTATGPSCTAANTASTAAIVLGDEAPGWLAQRGVAARLVDADGLTRTTGSWPVDLRQRSSA